MKRRVNAFVFHCDEKDCDESELAIQRPYGWQVIKTTDFNDRDRHYCPEHRKDEK